MKSEVPYFQTKPNREYGGHDFWNDVVFYLLNDIDGHIQTYIYIYVCDEV